MYFNINYFLFFLQFFKFGISQFSINTPPVLHLTRNWVVQSTEKIDSIVTRVRASDHEDNNNLIFGLEPIEPNSNLGLAQINQKTKKNSIPFRIDNRTGIVYINESLVDRVGENIFLYVTAFDGTLKSKNEVWARIVDPNKSNKSNNFPFHPTSIPTQFKQSILNNPSLKNPKIPQVIPEMSITSQKPTLEDNEIFDKNNNENKRIDNDDSKLNKNSEEIGNEIYEVDLEKVNNGLNNKIIENSKEIKDENNEKTEQTTLKTKISKNGSSINNTGVLLNTTVQIVSLLVICIAFTLIGVLSMMVKKKLIFVKKNNSKGDIVKELPGIRLSDNPMQNWRGPQAFSNRYESYERNYPDSLEEVDEKKIKNDQWEFPRHRLKIYSILGEGAFGQVWKCEATDINGKEGVTIVAVKTIKESETEKGRNDLISELDILKSLEPHPNVVRLFGCCTEKDPIFVIMEYVTHGKLQDYLRNSRAERCYGNMHGESKTLTSQNLTSFVYQVARGMEYISSKGIIHRDLAARNVLINEEQVCKVADFGLAKDVESTDDFTYECKTDRKLPIRWMAPESLYNNIFTIKSDIWSFGVFMWEVVTLGSTPYPGMSAADVMKRIRDGYRLEKPEHCRRELYNIMYYCWDKEPKERPTFADCVALLEKLLTTETDYIELERFPDHSYYNMKNLSGEKL